MPNRISPNSRLAGFKQIAASHLLLVFILGALVLLIGCEKRGDVKPLWIAALPFHFMDTYNVTDGVVVAIGSDKEIYPETEILQGTLIGLDSKTGKELWQRQLETAGRYLKQGGLKGGNFIVAGAGLVFLRDQSNVMRAVDVHTGADKWQANGVLAILTIADDQVSVVNAQKKLAAIDTRSGAVQNVTELKWKDEIISAARMLVADGREYLAVDGELTAKDRTSGKQVWSKTLKTEDVEMLATRGLLVLTTYRTFIVMDGATGKDLWHYDSAEDAKLPDIDGDFAYTGLEAAGEYTPDVGTIRGFKLATGEKVMEIKSGGMVANGLIYDIEWVDHYDYVSKHLVDGYQWRESSDVRLVAKDVRSGAKIWTADPWCWGWIANKSVVDDVIYAPHVSVLATEPVRLLAYRTGRGSR